MALGLSIAPWSGDAYQGLAMMQRDATGLNVINYEVKT